MKSNTSLRRLLVGSVAVITATAGAQAADLPSRKAEPVQYVKICDAYGAGFFYIPGTDTCLRVGGYVRAVFQYTPAHAVINAANGQVSQVPGDIDTTGMEFRGRVKLDARTQTQWGTVQTIVQLRGTNSDGIRATGGEANFQTAYAPAGNKASTLTMERAYIRFAGISAGLIDETFENVPGPSYFFTGNDTSGFSNGVKALKYTAIFGDFTWENAIESRGDFAYDNGAATAVAPFKVSTFTNSTYVNQPDTGYNLVSTLTFTQSWGHAAISGAVGNNSTAPVGYPDTNNTLLGPQKYGSWAVGGEVDIKLPFIAPGDEFFINAAYGDLLGEVGGGPSMNNFGADSPNKRVLGGVIRIDSLLTPTSVDTNGNPLSYGSNYAFETFASITHYWTPQWRSNFGVGYFEITPATANCSTISSGACVQNGGLNTQWGKGSGVTVQGNIIWSPAKDFDIGIEEEWGDMRNKLQNPSSTFVAAGQPGLSQSGFNTQIRLQRTF